jgi:integrase
MLDSLRQLLVGCNINNLPPNVTIVHDAAPTITPAVTPTTPNAPSGALISEVVKEFVAEKLEADAWRNTTAHENKQIFKRFIEIVGDIPISAVTHEMAREVKATLKALPPRMSTTPQFKRKSVQQLINTPIQEKLSLSSTNKYIERIGALFNWAHDNHYTSGNPFSTLKTKKKRGTSSPMEERTILTSTDLTLYFNTPLYKHHKYKDKPYKFWLPIIALYTGMRLEEIADLCVEDIVLDQGIWVFDINVNNKFKKVKTASSVRLIPVHSYLIAINFLKYVNSIKKTANGPNWLFPDITSHERGRSFYPSKAFGEYRKKFGWVGQKPNKDFHSFRHTVTNFWKQNGVPEPFSAALLGHSQQNITYGRYGDPFLAQTLKPVLDTLSFTEVTAVVKPWP